jgi:quinolinate synthase
MNDLQRLVSVFERPDNEIEVDPTLGQAAMKPLDRMLAFAASLNNGVVASR